MFDPWQYSHYLTRLLQSNKVSPALINASLDTQWTRFSFAETLTQLAPQEGPISQRLTIGLRRLRQRVYSHLIIKDLKGLASVNEVTQQMSDLAEFCVQQAQQVLMDELIASYGVPLGRETLLPQELLVIAMGKLGGRELNVSSDIDLIFAYEEEGETQPSSPQQRSISNQDFFHRLGQQLNKLLSDITEEGFVFRVDLRLRPNGTAGPLVVNLAMLEDYFTIQGRDWERYAWIKARVISNPDNPHVQRGTQALIEKVTPFVYRRHLDFSAMSALRTIHRLIREEAKLTEIKQTYRGTDIKLGPGGIREIEFIAQVFQLIHGGQDKKLRTIPTLEVLEILAERGFISQEDERGLKEAYIFLRQLEHRIQYREDLQIHYLPVNNDEMTLVALSMNFPDRDSFMAKLNQHRELVSRVFNTIFPKESEIILSSGDQLWQRAEVLLDEHYQLLPDASLIQKLSSLKNTFSYRAQTPRTREQFDIAMGKALTQIIEDYPSDQHETIINRFLRFMEAISRKASYVILLVEYPNVLKRLIDLLNTSEWASLYITQRPQLLDEFLKRNPFDKNLKDYWLLFRDNLLIRLNDVANDTEEQMHILRRAKHQQTFQILLQDLQKKLSVTEVADQLSAMADILAEIVLHIIWQQYPKKHLAQPKLAVIAYGKWGSKEMGYASDLDLVFLHNDDHPDAQTHYSYLVKKFSQWMVTPLGTGILYDIDMQLRPNGSAGLLVSPVDAFYHYHHQSRDNAAWVWEHQALTRARFCCGDQEVGLAFNQIRFDVLTKERDRHALKQEILSMRQRMYDGHPNTTNLFDIKHDQGGMIDIEFIVQFLILAYAHQYPNLTENLGNVALLRRCAELGLLHRQEGEALAQCYIQYREWQHLERLKGASTARIPHSLADNLIKVVRQSWQRLLVIN
ncbi:MAG: bifunctional [glutamate--ammonia ligase]-adenylyl-L-tyrosine phosphorylase/[glutamate--ammonia-ligase] adenylyltransferase [Betaproteobacteria bacterium]|nr:bifunctional [glutamate--ammonia ligase]-adenylyl-L-tyrosine phosphorylase/[glutamate--ammonia-ligase] adenylyltransferase [Betaproteobacteria bacterium]